MNVPTKKLNNNIKMPVLGLGTWKAQDGSEVENSVLWALDAGYRLIDTAKIYGNEQGVGRGINKSGISRQEIFLTTKLWNDDQGYESALSAIDESLEKLGTNYVDLYLIHWPFTNYTQGQNRRKDSWRALEKIYKSGKAKSIGVSNYTLEHLEEMKSYASVPPAVNQVEFHPFLFQKKLMDYCQENNIVLEAYSPLSRGIKTQDPVLTAIGKTHGKTNAQVMLRWNIQHGNIAIPKSTTKERINENLNIFDFELSEKDMLDLDALNQGYRIVTG